MNVKNTVGMRLIEALNYTAAEMYAHRMTKDQAIDEVRRRVSKQDILDCFKDPSVDAADAQYLKEMLKIFYGTELSVD